MDVFANPGYAIIVVIVVIIIICFIGWVWSCGDKKKSCGRKKKRKKKEDCDDHKGYDSPGSDHSEYFSNHGSDCDGWLPDSWNGDN